MDHVLQSSSKNTINTDKPKFVDPSMAAISPYFKRSMLHAHL